MSLELLNNLATDLRTMQLFYHNCHNTMKGPTFNADHGIFGDFYSALESDYDSIIERMIGLSSVESVNLSQLNVKAASTLQHIPSHLEPVEMFKLALGFEHQMLKICEAVANGQFSSGTKQLVGDVANASEMRIYKIKQRIK